MAKDPVCGMECDPKSSTKVEYQGETYYFCNPECRSAFERDPKRYVGVHEHHEGHHGMHHHGGHH